MASTPTPHKSRPLIGWARGRPGLSALLPAITALLTLGLFSGAGAHDYTLENLSIGHIWAPPTGAEATGAAVYGPLLNRGATDDRLVDASSPKADTVRFRTVTDGESRWLEAIDLPSNKPVSLAEWQEHIWLEGLTSPLEKGGDFDLTLEFAKSGTITVTVVVEKAAGH